MIIFRNSTIFFKMQGLSRDVSIVVYKMLYDEVIGSIDKHLHCLKSLANTSGQTEVNYIKYCHICKYWRISCVYHPCVKCGNYYQETLIQKEAIKRLYTNIII